VMNPPVVTDSGYRTTQAKWLRIAALPDAS
jgi:hypothetical protein